MTNPTTSATASTYREFRNRAVIRIDDKALARMLDLPAGQRIIGFEPNFFCLAIDAHIEGDGLPEVPAGALAPVLNDGTSLHNHWLWTLRGSDLAEMVQTLVDKHAAEGGALVESLKAVLDGGYDPRRAGRRS